MHYLVTGGAGFIGSNYAHRLLQRGENVTIYDNLSRRGAEVNLQWLRDTCGEFNFIQGDVRNPEQLKDPVSKADVIVHLASQVAVTTSVEKPRMDFESNALGTFNVLEAARVSHRQPILIYASTNKVYGGMENVIIQEHDTRYVYRDYPHGIPETYPLDFHSPYGCSKGAGDQYVRDYARIYDLPTVVFRQSCIYGPRQFGVEDQGWVAWFIIAAIKKHPLTIYGDGKQVRDLLYVEDLLNVYDAAVERIDRATGQVYNVGGGSQNQLSIWCEFGPLLEQHLGYTIPIVRSTWRPGDQRIYVSDIRKAKRELDWQPQVSVKEGIVRLCNWVLENKELFE